jgi:hypothetical protein
MTDEVGVLSTDSVFKWDGPKRKQTVIGARLGRLVLTDRRLVFLSTGSNDLTVGKVAAAGATRGASALRVSSTAALDASALGNDGSLEVAVSQLVRAELKGMFKVLVVWWKDASGTEQAATFAPKNGGMPAGMAWVQAINDRAGGGTASAVPPSPAPQMPQPVVAVPAGWVADPTGRHELRYWDGSAWTDHVSDSGVAGLDPIG